MWYLVCLFASLAAASAITTEQNVVVRSESDLRKYVFSDYDKLVRPAKNPRKTIRVDFGLALLAVNEVDEKNQVLVVDSWMKMKWTDDAFAWNPLDYDNITVLQIPSSEVWKPDLTVYTATPDTSLFPSSPTQALVYHNNDVLWVPMFTIRSRCPMGRRGDKNTIVCSIKIGSWTYSGPLLDLQFYNPGVDLTNFQDIHPEWKLQSVDSSRESKYYPCCTEEYPSLLFNVTLKRREGVRNTNKNEVWPDMF